MISTKSAKCSELQSLSYACYLKKKRRAQTFIKIFRSAFTALFPSSRCAISEMSVRWSFKAHQWEPTRSQLLQISSIIQPEEKSRIARFHFMRDAKSSLVGRLLIRKLINSKTGAPNHLIKLARDEHNKPILVSPKLTELGKFKIRSENEGESEPAQDNAQDNQLEGASSSEDKEKTGTCDNLNFNVSHQGRYVVLVSEPSASLVGIDVMNIEKPGRITDSVEDYFRLMNRQFTENEWTQIRKIDESIPPHFKNKAQLTNFTRFWCLKESYVKAVGVGIVIDLRSIDFTAKSELNGPDLVTDTSVKVDGKESPEWRFEEKFLDDLHIVTVARRHNPQEQVKQEDENKNKDGTSKSGEDESLNSSSIPNFENISLDFLLEGMTTLGSEDQDWVDEFLKKK